MVVNEPIHIELIIVVEGLRMAELVGDYFVAINGYEICYSKDIVEGNDLGPWL